MIVLFLLVLAALSASGRVIFTKVGSNVILECGGSRNDITWKREGFMIYRIVNRLQTRGSSEIRPKCSLKQNNLECRGVTKADAGTFTCTAPGHNQEISLVVFTATVTPSHDLQVGDQASFLCEARPEGRVHWLGPDDTPRFESSEARLDRVEHQHAGTWKCSLSYGGETHTESLVVTVKDPAPATTLPPLPPPPPTRSPGSAGGPPGGADEPPTSANAGPLGVAWWMWAVIGGGGLVAALLLAILIGCLCRRVRRRRRLARKMKNLQLRTPVQYCQCDGPTAVAKPQQRRQRAKPSAPPPQTLLVE